MIIVKFEYNKEASCSSNSISPTKDTMNGGVGSFVGTCSPLASIVVVMNTSFNFAIEKYE
jgi:hypothetical protein